eukprot:COSAG01_NODE_32638_length_578_cov_0.691023_1_plen_69_part_01
MVPCRAMLLGLLACAPAAQIVPVEHELPMPGGDIRRYLLLLPPGFDRRRAAPAVLDFHGDERVGAWIYI